MFLCYLLLVAVLQEQNGILSGGSQQIPVITQGNGGMALKVSPKKSHGFVPVVLMNQGAGIYLDQCAFLHQIIRNLFGHLFVLEFIDYIVRGRYLISRLQVCLLYLL